jgi:hypothetical protein
MMAKLYTALRAVDVPDAMATAAAEEAAEHTMELQGVKSTLRLHTWILTFNTAMLLAVAGKLFLGD